MTNAEFIELLQTFPAQANVDLRDPNFGGAFGSIAPYFDKYSISYDAVIDTVLIQFPCVEEVD